MDSIEERIEVEEENPLGLEISDGSDLSEEYTINTDDDTTVEVSLLDDTIEFTEG